MKKDRTKLERVEWTQYWAESCDEDKPFVLMIGDSISCGYRHEVYERIKDKYCAVTISTSKALDNPSFLREIKFIAAEEGFEYSVIHFNNGIHGYHLSTEEYILHYEEAVLFLRNTFPDAKLILCLSTPNLKSPENIEYAPWNDKIRERNEAVRGLAEKYSLQVDDLYSVADKNKAIIADDGVHFTMDGYRILADAVAGSILA